MRKVNTIQMILRADLMASSSLLLARMSFGPGRTVPHVFAAIFSCPRSRNERHAQGSHQTDDLDIEAIRKKITSTEKLAT